MSMSWPIKSSSSYCFFFFFTSSSSGSRTVLGDLGDLGERGERGDLIIFGVLVPYSGDTSSNCWSERIVEQHFLVVFAARSVAYFWALLVLGSILE
jgi:hypothetical protein